LNLPTIPPSRKLISLIVVLCALLLLCILAIVAVSVFGMDTGLFEQIGALITGIGIGHQVGQTMADRSPNYQPSESRPKKDNRIR